MTFLKSLSIAGMCLWAAATSTGWAADDHPRSETIFKGDLSVMGEPIVYPPGNAEVAAVIVTLLPGQETGWHRHGVPLFGYILEGEVVVDYGERGTRTYMSGDGFMEALAIAHNGRNTGDNPCRILAIFMGAQGKRLSMPAHAQD